MARPVLRVGLVSPAFWHLAHRSNRSRIVRVADLLARNAGRLLIPLNVCRKDKYYLPWECENERHAYEKCVPSVSRSLSPRLTDRRARCQYDE